MASRDMEAEYAAQNVYLQAVALDLGTVTIGAFDDSSSEKDYALK
jgi:nitroreductase